MRALVLLALAGLTGCGEIETQAARDPFGPFIGGNVNDFVLAVGKPSTHWKLDEETLLFQWTITDNSTAFKLTVPGGGGISLGGGGHCTMVATVLREGTLAGLAFPSSSASFTAGPRAVCGQLVGDALLHPNKTALPAGYDAFKYWPNTDGTKAAAPAAGGAGS